MDRSLCAHCQRTPVAQHGRRVYTYCSRACMYAARRRVVLCANACGQARKNPQSVYCGEACRYAAWVRTGGRAKAAAATTKALAARQANYAARLRERLRGMTTKAEVWRTAYRAGFHAHYASYLRAIRRGDLVVVRDRRMRKDDAA